jgi:tetratricopeptide (TPR) repeat protein
VSTSNSKVKIPSVAYLDELVKAGNIALARKLIRNINRNAIAATEFVNYAAIANRVYEPRVAYRFLHSVVRESQGITVPSEAEKIEFAEALRGMGLIQESINLLKEADSKLHPVVFLRLSFCYMTQWRYHEAIPCLKRYIDLVDPNLYSSTIARVNLAAALINEKLYDEAQILLSALRAETKHSPHGLLFGNCLELAAQISVLQGDFKSADKIIEEASLVFGQNLARYSTYLQKWRAISRSLQSGTVDPDLIACRQIATQDSDWETIRDCDLYLGYLTKNEELINKVYWGTPYDSYRRRVVDLVGEALIERQEFIWVADRSKPLEKIFDLLTGTFDLDNSGLETGQLIHRMLILLAKDFYRPLSVGTAFSELFPDEHFFQSGSTNRIFQLIKRLRVWLLEVGQPFSVKEVGGSYSLHSSPGIGIRICHKPPILSTQALTWEKFKQQIHPHKIFTRKEVIHHLKCSPTNASRFIGWSIETKQCEPLGQGRQRKYRLIG